MPAQFGIIVAKPGGGINFVAVESLAVRAADTTHADVVVLDFHHKRVDPEVGVRGEVKFKGGKESFVRTEKRAVDKDMRLVIHTVEGGK